MNRSQTITTTGHNNALPVGVGTQPDNEGETPPVATPQDAMDTEFIESVEQKVQLTRNYYETYWSSEGYQPLGRLGPAVAELFERELPHAPFTCLDVGCGDALLAAPWVTRHGGSYTGVDISQQALAMAEANGFSVSHIEDAASLPFEDNAFDVVLCIEVLEHLFSPQLAAAEIKRVLRPGGKVLATVPNVAYIRNRVQLALFGGWSPMGDDLSRTQPWRDPHIRFFTADALRRMWAEAGFTEVSVGGHEGSMFRGVLGHIPHVGRRFRASTSSRLFRSLERRNPALLSNRLHLAAMKPTGEQST